MTASVTILKSDFTKIGGAEKYARYLAHKFHQKGCPVTVLTTEPVQGNFPFEVVSMTPQSKTSVSKLWDFERFCEDYLKRYPTEIIFGLDRNRMQTHIRASNGVHKCYLKHRLAFEPKWKYFRHMLNPLHSSLLHIEKTSFEHPQLRTLFANSHLIKQEILSCYRVDPEKICVIHNGVQWEDWQEEFDASFEQIRTGPYQFLFIGNNFHRKGLFPLLRGMKNLLSHDFHLHVIGYDKNLRKFIHACEKWGLQNRVSFHGRQTDILPFLQQCDCLVIPSFYDPFANVTLEALAMGLFVISSKMNGGSEILTRETGRIIDDLHDEIEMKKTLENALMHPKTLEQARLIRHSIQHLDFSLQLDTYVEKCLSPI